MNQTYKVQVSMNQASIVQTDLVFKQGDFGFNVEIEVLDFDTTGVSSKKVIWRKNQGAVEGLNVSQIGNKFTYTIVGTEFDTPGPGVCDLKLYDSTTKRISTASFRYMVEADTMDGFNEQASSYSDTIAQIASTIHDYAQDSEAWAVGTINGVPVGGSDPRNGNNSKWYADRAQTDAANSQQIYTQFVGAMGIGTFTYLSNGHLYYDAAPVSSYTFSLNNGHLVLN